MSSSIKRIYSVGKILVLNIGTGPTFLPEIQPTSTCIQVTIRKLIEYTEFAVVLQVVINPEQFILHGSRPAILKLYDRRHASRLRRGIDRHAELGPWNADYDDAFVDLAQSEKASDYGEFDQNGKRIVPRADWNAAEREVYVYKRVVAQHNKELKAYAALESLQGTRIPKLYANVYLESKSASCDIPCLQVNGILLEKITGFHLSRIRVHAPREAWQRIGDNVIATISEIDEHDVLLGMMHPGHVLIQRLTPGTTENAQYNAIVIDLAVSKLREDTSAAEWTRWKCNLDEEGQIGWTMMKGLSQNLEGRVGSLPFIYQPTYRYSVTKDGCKGPLGEFPDQTR